MRREKKRDADQYALLIWNVFRGKEAQVVTFLLQEQKILKSMCQTI